jgi:organic radical activating enzyme
LEYTIEITQYCPHNCNYCSSNASDKGRHLPFEKIRDFLKNAEPFDRINISGGEPLAHPDFWEILQLCKNITPNVWVYTNALPNIRYNTSIVKEITVEANVCLVPGEDAYIPKTANEVHLLQLVSQGRAKNIKPANIHVSGNCINQCSECTHIVLQADGKIVSAPCKKEYVEDKK